MNSRISVKQIARLKSGDRKAFEEIYYELHSTIYNYCFKYIRNSKLCEEITADTFVILWQKRNIIDAESAVEAFLYKVARDKSLNHLKKIARDSQMKTEFLGNYLELQERSVERKYIEKEDLSLVEVAISKLPTKQQQVFRLKYLDGLSYKEIAQKLDVSVNTIKAHLRQARRYLSKKL